MALSRRNSIHTIAEATGLSAVTVSRILVGKTKGLRRDAVERARRVEAVAAEIGFRPSAAARSIKSSRTRTVGLMITTSHPDAKPANLTHQYETVLGIEEMLADHDHSVLMLRMHDVIDAVKLPRVFRENLIDGMIVLGDTPDRVIDRVREISPKSVLIETNRNQLTSCVSRDEYAAGREIAEQAVAAGYRRVIYLSGFSNHFSVEQRLAGVRDACVNAGVADFQVKNIDSELSADRFDAVIDQVDRTTAVLVYGVAYAARIAHLASRRRLVAGVDYGLAAAEELVLDALSWPELARIRNDRWHMGSIAARMMLGQLDGDTSPPASVKLAGTFVPGLTLSSV